MPVTGTTARITTADGRDAFTKTLAGAPPLFFEREAVGLRALAAAGARVPDVLEVSDDHLTLAWVEPGHGRTAQTEERFGQELAELHLATAQGGGGTAGGGAGPGGGGAGPGGGGAALAGGGAAGDGTAQGGVEVGAGFGSVDGEPTAYLGACPVDLTPTSTWHESWVERRVVPLARRAAGDGHLDPATAALAERITPERLGPVEPPTLVHGGLWGGNRMVDASGRSWLVDPCAHLGHREVDLAMMQLFGGFSGRVFAAYAEAHPLADGWRERVVVYQTVPLLVHAILFGGGYGVEAADALRAATR